MLIDAVSLKDALSRSPVGVTFVSRGCTADKTERGSDSRLPPNIDAGASARIEALVSRLLRRRRFDEDASVRIEASSVRTLLAVAV